MFRKIKIGFITALILFAVYHTIPDRIIDYKSILEQPEAIEVIEGVITAYSSSPDETSGDPFLMASGKRVYLGAIANNCLPFGTRVFIVSEYFIVEDRMNKRYSNCNKDSGVLYFDIWLPEKQLAREFGIQYYPVEIPVDK